MGKKLFSVGFELWCKLEKCLKRVEKGENARELHTARLGLIRDTPYERALHGRNRALKF